MFAEAVWMYTNDGKDIFPLEIAFLNQYNETYTFQLVPPFNLWMTVRDINNNKSRFLCRDRFSNHCAWRRTSRGPVINYRISPHNWQAKIIEFLKRYRDTLSVKGPIPKRFFRDYTLQVRGPAQKKFFTDICGWKDVEMIKCPSPLSRNQDYTIVGYPHRHYSNFMGFRPCAVVEVKTMAKHYKPY